MPKPPLKTKKIGSREYLVCSVCGHTPKFCVCVAERKCDHPCVHGGLDDPDGLAGQLTREEADVRGIRHWCCVCEEGLD